MKILKLILIIAPAFKIINYSKKMSMIIYTINTSDEDWGGNLMQVEWNGK